MKRTKEIKQLTYEQACLLAKSETWKAWSFKKRALFQLQQDRLCMPFDKFHEAVEKALKRPVYTHEFALNRQGLLDELKNGITKALTLDEMLALIPSDKQVVVVGL